jgi:hypothetical protein
MHVYSPKLATMKHACISCMVPLSVSVLGRLIDHDGDPVLVEQDVELAGAALVAPMVQLSKGTPWRGPGSCRTRSPSPRSAAASPCLAHLRGHLVRSRRHGWFLLLVTFVHGGQAFRVSFFVLARAQVSDCKLLHQSEEGISAPIPVRCAGWIRQMNQSTQKMGRFWDARCIWHSEAARSYRRRKAAAIHATEQCVATWLTQAREQRFTWWF